MTSATSPSLHVRRPKRRTARAGGVRIAAKALMGLAVTVTVVAAVSATTIGTMRLLTVTFEPQPATRSASVFAEPSSWLAWNKPLQIGAVAQRAIVAGLALPAQPDPLPVSAVVSEPTLTAEPALALAFAPPDSVAAPLADPEVTGSLGTFLAKPAAIDIPSERSPVSPQVRADAPPLPRPRPRPGFQLASLTPPDVPGIKPEVDTRFARAAIYDITAQVVYLPNGERLEAHSGLGSMMDDPRHVHRKNVGATPPNIYKLTMREALFHGVRAIRLTPLNERDMFGRDGILAHTYMLGPSGQSNGCVSFKDYPRFLRAFLRGEFDRMIVVRRLDKPPTSFARRDVRSASNTF